MNLFSIISAKYFKLIFQLFFIIFLEVESDDKGCKIKFSLRTNCGCLITLDR